MIAGLFIYIYIVLGIMVFMFDTLNQAKKSYYRVWHITYIFLALLAAFSYKVGPDTQTYMDDFKMVPNIFNLTLNDFFQTRNQPFYVVMCSLCKTVYNDFIMLQMTQVFLIYHSLYLLLKRLDLMKFWVLFLFFGYCYFALLSGRRECFGLACCLYAILFFMKRQWLPYYLLVLAGFLFHSGMIIFAVFPFVKTFKKMSLSYIILLAFIVFLVQYSFDALRSLSRIVNEDDSILRYTIDHDVEMGFTTILLITVELLIVLVLVVKGNSSIKGNAKDIIYIGILSIILSYLSGVLPILYRYRVHFAVFQYYVIQECFYRAKKNVLEISIIFLIFSYSPIATFSDAIKKSNSFYYYCSVFSSDTAKIEMNSVCIR